MFSEEELDRIARTCPRESSVRRGSYSGSYFANLFALSTFFAILLIYLSLSGILTVSLAASVGGTGGFVLEIDELAQESIGGGEPPELFIYPAVAETSECRQNSGALGPEGRPDPDTSGDPGVPVLKANIENAEVPSNTSMSIKKAIRMPSFMPELDNIVIELNNEIRNTNGDVIGYGDVDINDASLLVSDLKTRELHAQGNFTVNERYSDPTTPVSSDSFAHDSPFGPAPGYQSDPDPANLGEFVIEGEEAVFTGATGVGHFISFRSMTISKLNAEVKYNVANPPLASTSCPE